MNETDQRPSSAIDDDEIDLRELFRALWAGKWVIGGTAFVATVIAVLVALMLPNIYRAEALLAPNDQERASGLSALADQYGGLASLAGINIGGGSTNKTALSLQILQSRKFIAEFIERRDILVPLIAARDWNSETGELTIDPDLYDTTAERWVRDARPPNTATPSSQEAYRVLSDILFVSEDKKTGFVTLAIEHYSPFIAKQWVDWLVEDINSTVLHQDVADAEQAIAYLNEQISATSLAGLQNVFFRLIEEQTKTVMLAKASPEFVLRTLDPAVAPELKAKPKRSLIAILGLLFGGTVGLLIVFFRTDSKVGRD